jgi:hypothetical protein
MFTRKARRRINRRERTMEERFCFDDHQISWFWSPEKKHAIGMVEVFNILDFEYSRNRHPLEEGTCKCGGTFGLVMVRLWDGIDRYGHKTHEDAGHGQFLYEFWCTDCRKKREIYLPIEWEISHEGGLAYFIERRKGGGRYKEDDLKGKNKFFHLQRMQTAIERLIDIHRKES